MIKLFFLLVFSINISAFNTSLVIRDMSLKLQGTALLEYGIFGIDIYELAYYKGENSSALLLSYKIDVKKEYSEEGWNTGFKSNLENMKEYSKQIKWICENTPSIKEGDILTLLKENKRVTLYLNNRELARIDDSKVAKLIHLPWIGPRPIDEEIKRKLLKL